MARREFADRLETSFECTVPWDAMAGDASRRFCDECRCQVFDFARMERREIEARLEASRGGRLCARITRQGGRLVTLAPPAPEPLPARRAERAPALAAGFFGAWLSLAAAAYAAPASEPATLVAAPAAEPENPGLPASMPASAPVGFPAPAVQGAASESVEAASAEVEDETMTLGIIDFHEPTLRELYDASELTFVGKVGHSQVIEIRDDIAEVRTTLRVARRFQGSGSARFVTYRHSVPVEAFGPELLEPLPELTPGALVLAFLSPAPGQADAAGRPVYETTSYAGLRGLTAEEAAAYSSLLEDLAQLRRAAGPDGELDAAGLLEWQVAAAENPVTRKERTIPEIRAELDATAGADGGDDLPASHQRLTADQEARLAAALLATPTMGRQDLDLYELVRGFDPEAATRWVTATLANGVVPEEGDTLYLLEQFAEPLGDSARADDLLEAAEERFGALDEASAGSADHEEKRQELIRALFAELARLLENPG